MTSRLHTDENGLNGINSNAWSNPVAGQPDGKLYASRIMKLFSNSRKGSIPTDGPSSAGSNHSNGGPPPWPGLSGLGVVDSFKKLRSSVLQGIQSRGATNNDGEGAPFSNQQMANGTVMTNVNASDHFKFAEGYSVSNGINIDQKMATVNQCGSDYEDFEDDENDEGDGLQRNSRFSRSIRRAYGAGRISLLDTGNGRREKNSTNDAAGSQTLSERSKVNDSTENFNVNTNVKVLSRLSKSADNLNLFKMPFRGKAPSPGPPQPDSVRTSRSDRTSNIQRTASASSVDLQGQSVGRRKSPIRPKEQILKLVGSVSDLTVRQRRSSSPGPSPITPLSPTSRLHDDYARRLPCLSVGERQRRPSPTGAQVTEETTHKTQASVEHIPLIHPQPECEINTLQHHALISPVYLETQEPTEQISTTISDHTQKTELDSSQLNPDDFSESQDQTEVTLLPNEVRKLQIGCVQMKSDFIQYIVTFPFCSLAREIQIL